MSDSSKLKNKLIHKNKTKKSKLKQFIVQKEEKKKAANQQGNKAVSGNSRKKIHFFHFKINIQKICST